MKKNFVVFMAAILTIVAIIGFTTAEADGLIPQVIMEKPENSEYDGHEIHMDMYMTMPEYGDVIVKIAVSRDDTATYGNSGTATAYTAKGEYIGDIGGAIIVDFGSCETIEDMRNIVIDYVASYEYYERDAQEGLTYDKIYIW